MWTKKEPLKPKPNGPNHTRCKVFTCPKCGRKTYSAWKAFGIKYCYNCYRRALK